MKASRVVISVMYNYVNLVFMAGTGFIYTAFMLRHLSHNGFGILALTSSLLSYTGLLNLGVGLTVMKMVAERAHNDVNNEIPRIVGNALILFGAVSVLAVAAALCLEPFAGAAFHLTGANKHTFRVALVVATPSIALTLPSALYTAVHQAFQDYRYIAILSVVSQGISVIVGVVLLLLGHGVVALVAIGSIQTVIAFVLKGFHARRKLGLRLELRRIDWQIGRGMLATSVWVLLLNVAAQAIFSTDVIVVGAVLGTVAVAAYQVALGPAMGVKNVSDQFGAVSLTAAASLNAQEAYGEVRRLMTEATRVVVATVGPGVVVFAVWGRRLIELWAGRSYAPSYSTLVVLSVALLIAAVQGTSSQLLFALNRYKRLALLGIAEAATNVILSVILAKHVGIVGVAWGTAIPITVMTLGVYVPMACRLVGLRYIDLIRRLLLPLTLNGGMYLVLRQLTRGGGIFSNIVELLAACLCVFITCFSLSILLDPKERDTYLDMLKGAVVRLQE